MSAVPEALIGALILSVPRVLLWAGAVVNALIQLFDLHTTAEGVKHGWAKETNKRLQWLNDASVPWTTRFWRLATIKAFCILGVAISVWIALPGAWWFQLGAFAVELALAWFYWPIMATNLRIYESNRGGGAKL